MTDQAKKSRENTGSELLTPDLIRALASHKILKAIQKNFPESQVSLGEIYKSS